MTAPEFPIGTDQLSGEGAFVEGQPNERMEEALARAERAEATYRALVHQIPAITYVEALDNARVISVSPQVEAILGYSQEEWLANARLWVDLLHPQDRDRVVAACERANRTKEPYSQEFRMLARDGRIVWIRDEAVLVHGSHGQPLCWQGVMVEIDPLEQFDEGQGA
jgi:PAS domain S-box-containing protein